MKGIANIVGLCFAPVLIFAAPAAAGVVTPQPFQLVRSLEALQDQIVLGNAAASVAESRLVAAISEGFTAAPRTAWRVPKNVRAAVIYLLSGGKPEVIKGLLGHDAFPRKNRKLVKGALAIDEGHKKKAEAVLSSIKVRSLPAGLAGYVAFAEAGLFGKQDPHKAMELLDVARLVAPGTLVEEAALRRESFLADEMGDDEKFVFLSRQYLERFAKSLYAANFRRRLTAAIVHLDFSRNPGIAAHVDDMLHEMKPDERRDMLLVVARAAIIDGRTAAARFAVDTAEPLTPAKSVEKARLALYDAAALLVSDDYEKGVDELEKIDRSQLPASDAELYAAVASLAQQIGKWSSVTRKASDGANPDARNDDRASAQGSITPVIKLAEQSLDDARRLLKERSP